jgi:YkoY family integral membrane protein
LESTLVTDLVLVLQLIILEGLLSFDNALALAALVTRRLSDPDDRKKALTWGIWGAYFFRAIVVVIGVWLMKHEWIKAVAGLYLVQMAVRELFFKKEHFEAEAKTAGEDSKKWFKGIRLSPLWSTIIAVEVMDIMFSIDSIAAALALSSKVWVLMTGAILGILLMRVAANSFVVLIHKFPILEKTAFVLVLLAGVNVCLKLKDLDLGFMMLTIDKPIPEHMFTILLFSVFFGSLLLNARYPHWFKPSKVGK